MLSAFAVWAFSLPVETIGSRFGELPRGLPPSRSCRRSTGPPRRTCSRPRSRSPLLGAIESLLCARVADGLIDDRHDPNQELMAQGIANFASPLFGGIAVTGTIARTMTNVKSGARSPVAGIVHARGAAAGDASRSRRSPGYIPLAALAAVLLWVAFNMVPWRELRELRHFSMFYRAILLSTFALTVVFDLTVAIEVGLVLASLFFIYRISSLTKVEPIALPPASARRFPTAARVGAWRLFGSIFFGSVTKLESLLDPARAAARRGDPRDAQGDQLRHDGAGRARGLHDTLVRRGGRLILADLNEQPLSLLRRSGLLNEVPVVASLEEALATAAKP